MENPQGSGFDNLVVQALLDEPIEQESAETEDERYLHTVLSILLMDRLAFGSPVLLTIQKSFCRATVTILLTGVIAMTYSIAASS